MHYNISTVGLCAAKVAVRNTVRLLSYTKGGKHLGVVDVYTKIPYDLSGSISKNSSQDYSELIRCKGITKAELNTMLDHHMEKTDNSVSLVQKIFCFL